jgi:hypothetical protein
MNSDDSSGGDGNRPGFSLGALGFGEEETDAHLRAATSKRRKSSDSGGDSDGDSEGRYKMGSQEELANQFYKRLFLIGFFLFFIGSVYYYWSDPSRGNGANGVDDGPKFSGPHRFVPSWYGNN